MLVTTVRGMRVLQQIVGMQVEKRNKPKLKLQWSHVPGTASVQSAVDHLTVLQGRGIAMVVL